MTDSKKSFPRRHFLKTVGAASLLAGGTLQARKASPIILPKRHISPNDKIRVAALGMGIIGFANLDVIARMPEAEFVAAADCYDGRLARVKEVYGDQVATTREYRELLAREDIDAVIINTPDHWHAQMAVDAMKAGKAAYIEKPVIQKVADGHRIIDTQRQTAQVAIVGSKQFRQPLYQKVKSLIQSGSIGVLNVVEATVSRNSAIGAWQYSIPSDASEKTIDWEAFQGPAPRRAFDADRFFRWRKYGEYGTGVSGDMFVHRLSALHFMLDSLGPDKISAMGGVRYWNDGRDAPDVLMALLDYPETHSHPAFTLILKANFADGSGGGPSYTFIGSEGVLEIRGRNIHMRNHPRGESTEQGLVEGYNSVRTFAKDQREEFVKEYRQYRRKTPMIDTYDFGGEIRYTAPSDYDSGLDHFGRFFHAIRHDDTSDIMQDPTFGLRAAAPSILPNDCIKQNKVFLWDPINMKTL
ncbi:MAG: Gfo/Idh/MocA family oxidoreductase [Bacteroidota bacterium]